MRRVAVEGTVAFVAHQAALVVFSRWFTGSWDWVGGAYGVMCVLFLAFLPSPVYLPPPSLSSGFRPSRTLTL
jgi:hypothetical protein